jgi:hypothetical protein
VYYLCSGVAGEARCTNGNDADGPCCVEMFNARASMLATLMSIFKDWGGPRRLLRRRAPLAPIELIFAPPRPVSRLRAAGGACR